MPLRHLARFVTGSTPGRAQRHYRDGGKIPWATPPDMSSSWLSDTAEHVTELALAHGAVRLLPAGATLVLSRGVDTARPVPISVTDRPIAASREITAIVCGSRLRPGFLWAFLASQSRFLQSQLLLSPGGTGSLPEEALRNLRVPCLPLGVQDEIASRRRQRISDIDTLIAAKRASLPYLAEKRQSVILGGVTRGISAATPLRPSGLPWIAEIPGLWETRKVGHLARLRTGATPPRDRTEYWANGTVPWVTSAATGQREITSSPEFVTDDAVRDCRLPVLGPGTVLVGTAGSGPARGQAAVLSVRATVNQNLIAVEPKPGLADPWYLYWVLDAARDHLREISDRSGNIVPRLTISDIETLRVPFPPLAEQQVISLSISREAEILDRIFSVTEHSIELLRELRDTEMTIPLTE